MGYKSPYMRFGNTRYEKNIVKLRWYDLKHREEAYKYAVETLNEAIAESGVPWTYVENVWKYADGCKQALDRGLVGDDDDAMLVFRYGKEALDSDEYDWMKGEFAKQGIDVEYLWLSK